MHSLTRDVRDLDVNGHRFYDRLQFSTPGRDLMGRIDAALRPSFAHERTGRVYLAGPMTGLPGHNFPAFNAEAAVLRAQGLHVENPADIGQVEGAEWADYIRFDLARLASCERIHLLPDWQESKGATLEYVIARELDMEVTYV